MKSIVTLIFLVTILAGANINTAFGASSCYTAPVQHNNSCTCTQPVKQTGYYSCSTQKPYKQRVERKRYNIVSRPQTTYTGTSTYRKYNTWPQTTYVSTPTYRKYNTVSRPQTTYVSTPTYRKYNTVSRPQTTYVGTSTYRKYNTLRSPQVPSYTCNTTYGQCNTTVRSPQKTTYYNNQKNTICSTCKVKKQCSCRTYGRR
jgi:hypothetical protein